MHKFLRSTIFLCLLSISSYAQVNLTSGLIAYYPFNGTLNDASGNGHHGTNMNGVSYGADPWGNANNAAFFDGIDDWISVAASPALTPGKQFSMAFRFKSSSTALQVLFSKSNFTGTGAPDNLQYQIGINGSPTLSNNGLFFATNHYNSCITTNFLASDYTYGNVANANQWYCVVLTFDNGVKKVYMNGVLISTKTMTGHANNTSIDSCVGGTFRIGSWWQGGQFFFKGMMDEVRMWNRPLNTPEIDSLCNLVTPAPTQTIINKYAAVTGAGSNCSNTFMVDDATGFGAGDTVLMIQMKGATIDSTNTSAFGSVLSYNGAGNYEFNVVSAVSGTNITLKHPLVRSYDIPNGRVQLVRVPYFQNYTVSQPHTCLPWNGSKGGIVVLNASGTVTLNAPIDVSQRGFRPGNVQYVTTAPCGETDYYYPASSNPLGAQKGEGIAELSTNRNHGRGAQGNGGGGGNSHNTGGGGGGNAGAGGLGGKETGIATCAPAQAVGGLGGRALSYSNSLNKVFMGGGSGAGHGNNNESGIGTPGGGIVLIWANSLVGNGQTVLANGGDGIGCVGDCWDGQPGGSAGGSILLHVSTFSGNVAASAKGGSGGSQAANNSTSGMTGPGGGGGGGLVWVKGTSTPSQLTTSLSGGARGVFLNTNDPWGTTDGLPGTTLSGLTMTFPTVNFVAPIVNLGKDTVLCSGDTLTLNAGSPGSTYLYSNGATTQTTKVFASGTYSVRVTFSALCTVRDTIVIGTSPNPVVKLGNDTVICPGATITLNGGSFGSGFAYLYSTGATTQTTNVTAAGTYNLRVTNLTTGCRGRDTIVITQGSNPIVNLGPDTAVCPGKTITLNAGNIGSTYLYNTGATTRTITVSTPGTYSVRVTNVNKCVGRDTIVIAQGVDPIVDLGPDTTTCEGIAVTIDAGHPGSSYLYSIGTTTQTLSVHPAGTYWVRVTTPQGCVGWDTINIYVTPLASVSTITATRTGPSVAFTSDAAHASSYAWSFGDGNSSTSAAPSHSYAANGSYTVRLVVSNECANDTAYTTVSIGGVGTGDITAASADLLVYPNPATTILVLENKSALKMQAVTVLNSLGAVVRKVDGIDAKKQSLDISALPAGVYMLHIQTDGGSVLRRVQVMK